MQSTELDTWAEHCQYWAVLGHQKKRPEMQTKVCEQCGKTYAREYDGMPAWRRRKYCSKECTDLAKCAPGALEQPQTKTCPVCGVEFSRPAKMPPSAWARRRYCGLSCSAKAGHKVRGNPHRYIQKKCDCGQPTIGTVWVVQGGGNGKLGAQVVEVCADCRDMWLEDGATLERPEVERNARAWPEVPCESGYQATAHVSSWHGRKGARPE